MTGKIVFGEGEKPNRYYLRGKEVLECIFREAFPAKPIGNGSGLVGWKPIASEACAVHPEQVDEAVEDAKDRKVPTEFLPDGRPVFTSRTHRAEYLKAYGFFDRDAGYGDPGRGSYKG